VSCPFGQDCVDGQCVEVNCGGVVCAEGQTCVNDTCEEDTCNPDECQEGQRCLAGACADDPCNGIECPPNQRCEIIDQTAQCVADWNMPVEPRPDMGMESGDMGSSDIDGDMGVSPINDDGGAGEIDGGSTNDESDATAKDEESTGDDDAQGCACDASPASSPSPFTLLGLALLGLIRLRRR